MHKRRFVLTVCLCATLLLITVSAPAHYNILAQSATAAATTRATQAATSNSARFGELLTPAGYFAPDAVFYTAIRTDSAFIETVDTLLTRIEQGLPETMLPASARVTLTKLLDLASQQTLQQDFSAVRKWLGGSLAFGLNNMNGLFSNYYSSGADSALSVPSYGLVVQITDQTAAANAVETVLKQTSPRWIRIDHEGIVMFTDSTTNPINGLRILIDKKTLFFGSIDGVTALITDKAQSLNDAPEFRAALALLPAPNYNAVLYIDTPRLTARSLYANRSSFSNQLLMLTLLRATGPQLIGATVLPGNTLTLDSVQRAGNTQMLEAGGLKFKAMSALHPDFMALLPANTIAAMQGNNLTAAYDNAISNLGALYDLLPVSVLDRYSGVLINALPPPDANNPGSGKASVQRLLRLINVFVTGATGMTDKEAQAIFSGDYLLSITNNPAYNGSVNSTALPVEFVALSQVTGPVDPQKIMNTLQRNFQLTFDSLAPDFSLRQEVINGTPILVITWSGGYSKVSRELLIGVNNTLAVVGLRRPVTDVLSRAASGGNSAATAVATKDATNNTMDTSGTSPAAIKPLLLQNAVFSGYWNLEATLPLVDVIYPPRITSGAAFARQQAESLRALIKLFTNATFSISTDASGDTVTRLTLSLK